MKRLLISWLFFLHSLLFLVLDILSWFIYLRRIIIVHFSCYLYCLFPPSFFFSFFFWSLCSKLKGFLHLLIILGYSLVFENEVLYSLWEALCAWVGFVNRCTFGWDGMWGAGYFIEVHPNNCSFKSVVGGYLVFPENTKNLLLEEDIVGSIEKAGTWWWKVSPMFLEFSKGKVLKVSLFSLFIVLLFLISTSQPSTLESKVSLVQFIHRTNF